MTVAAGTVGVLLIVSTRVKPADPPTNGLTRTQAQVLPIAEVHAERVVVVELRKERQPGDGAHLAIGGRIRCVASQHPDLAVWRHQIAQAGRPMEALAVDVAIGLASTEVGKFSTWPLAAPWASPEMAVNAQIE